MASDSLGFVALLSIRPQFAQAIMDGEKKVEFRKVKFRRAVSHIVVYATDPVRQIVGYFEVAGLTQATPERLWRLYGSLGAIGRRDFRSYYCSSHRGTAIAVGRVCAFRKPLPLSDLGHAVRPPQSFAYIPATAFAKMISKRPPGSEAAV